MVASSTMVSIVILPALLLSMVVPILLQVFLSTRQNKWLGLILPFISLLCALVLILNMAYIVSYRMYAVMVILSFLLLVVFLLIYWLCRRHLKRKTVHDEIKQMNIQDL